MVMHARKIPRLNDGYYDRNPAHPLEDKYPSKSHGSGYPERYTERKRGSPGPGAGRPMEEHRPSPRSAGKADRARLERGSTNSPGERRVNHHAGERHQVNDKASAAAGSKDHRAEIQRSALRVCADWSEHISSSGKKYYYNCRTEVSQWEKPKEWIDNASKIVNNEPNRARDKNGRERSHQFTSSSSKYDDRQRHSSGSGGSSGSSGMRQSSASVASSHHRPSSGSQPGDHRQYRHEDSHSRPAQHWSQHADLRDARDMPTMSRSMSDSHKTSRRGVEDTWGHNASHGYLARGSSLNSMAHNGARAADTQRLDDTRHSDDMDISPEHTPSHSRVSSRQSSCAGTPLVAAASTPGSSASTTVTSAGMSSSVLGAVAALPQILSIGLHDSPAPKPQPKVVDDDLTQQAIQTLQKLQQALLVQQLQQQQPRNNTQPPPLSSQPSMESSATSHHHHPTHEVLLDNHSVHTNNKDAGTPAPSPKSDEESPLPEVTLPSPQTNATTPQPSQRPPANSEQGRESPRSDRSVHSSKRDSPTPSQASSQSLSLGGSALCGAARKPDGQMAPSLAQYYKEELVKHLPACSPDSVERQLEQACMMSEEAHIIGSMHCGQVSMQLKKARSLVRIAEIQSTVQEQRVLFLRQQIKDLENMKSQTSFMPYSGT